MTPEPATINAIPGQQVSVDRRGLGGRHAVRESVVGLQRAVLHELRGQRPGVGVGHDLVVIAVHDQDRHADLLEVLGEVGLGEGHDAGAMRGDAWRCVAVGIRRERRPDAGQRCRRRRSPG
jgi:hypothetical protein